MIVVAVLFAGAAAFLVRVAMLSPATTAAAPMQAAVVAVRDLKAGEKLTPDLVRETQFPTEFLPKGFYSSRDQIFGGGAERMCPHPSRRTSRFSPSGFSTAPTRWWGA